MLWQNFNSYERERNVIKNLKTARNSCLFDCFLGKMSSFIPGKYLNFNWGKMDEWNISNMHINGSVAINDFKPFCTGSKIFPIFVEFL